MNMAFTARCLFILQCIFLMDISVADPLIETSPPEVTLGITSTLDINCTFSPNNHPDVAAFTSLVLSRSNSTGQNFEDLATITEFSPDSVTLSTQEKLSATGVLSQTGESFLQLSWQHPTALQAGVYKCSALGLGMMGQSVEMTNISSVTVAEANLNYILEKLLQLEMHEATTTNIISTMQNQLQNFENNKTLMEEKIQTLENEKITMEQRIESLEKDKVYMQQTINSLEKSMLQSGIIAPSCQTISKFTSIGRYQASCSYVSNDGFENITISIDVCESLGGHLAVIDNQDEYTAVKGLLDDTCADFRHIYISGTDEETEGNWVLPDSNTSLPFTAWDSANPFVDRRYNCLLLESLYSWLMHDWYCESDSPNPSTPFMCEIETT